MWEQDDGVRRDQLKAVLDKEQAFQRTGLPSPLLQGMLTGLRGSVWPMEL